MYTPKAVTKPLYTQWSCMMPSSGPTSITNSGHTPSLVPWGQIAKDQVRKPHAPSSGVSFRTRCLKEACMSRGLSAQAPVNPHLGFQIIALIHNPWHTILIYTPAFSQFPSYSHLFPQPLLIDITCNVRGTSPMDRWADSDVETAWWSTRHKCRFYCPKEVVPPDKKNGTTCFFCQHLLVPRSEYFYKMVYLGHVLANKTR